MKHFLPIFILAITVFSVLTILDHITVFSATIDELRKQRETISRDIDRKKQELEKKKQEEVKLQNQIHSLTNEIHTTEKRIVETEGKIQATQDIITSLSQQISDRELQLETEQKSKKEAIQVLYETTEQNPLFLIMGSKGISEAVDRASYLEALELKIESTITKITELKTLLEQERVIEHERQQNLAQLKRQQEVYRGGLDSQKQQRNGLLNETKKAQKTIEQLIEEAKKAYSDVNSELHRLQEAARKRGRTSGPKRTGSLTVGWPINGQITTRFGEPTFVQSFHTGIDIDCVVGDSIAAAANGTVTFAGGDRSYGYGLYVKIDHGDGVTTLYAHLSSIEVSVGNEVKLGQVLGYCGNTGYARAFMPGGDGSHLHFETREDDVPANPYIYLP